MRTIDWRELYAQNQAAIAEAGIPLPAMTLTAPRATSIPPLGGTGHRQLPTLLREHGPLVNPRLRDPGVRSTWRRGQSSDSRPLCMSLPA